MSNVTKVLDMIANESLAVAHEKATFISTVNRQFDDSFGGSGPHKTGSSLRIRYPNQYTRRTSSRVMDVQDQGEKTQTLTLATQDGVDMRFNSAELTLDTNNPSQVEAFSKRYIEPAMSSLISGIDGDAITQFSKDIYNTVGTAGTVVGASGDTSAINAARAKLNQYLAPKDANRNVMIDSVTMGSVVNANKALFVPDAQLKKAFTEGYYGRVAGADWYENDRTWTLANGSDVTGTTDATGLGTADTTDSSYSTLDMHTTIAVAAQNVGEVFTIAGVYACHPETKAAYSHLQQFVITGSSGNFSTISPAIYLTGAKKNVCSATGADLATTTFDSATLAFVGSLSVSYRQNLMYHQDAFTFVTADLPIMDDAAKCIRKSLDGLSLRVWMGSDIRNDELLVRLDILYGFKTIRPEWGCRITN